MAIVWQMLRLDPPRLVEDTFCPQRMSGTSVVTMKSREQLVIIKCPIDNHNSLPKNKHGNGKSPFLIGTTSWNGWFSIIILSHISFPGCNRSRSTLPIYGTEQTAILARFSCLHIGSVVLFQMLHSLSRFVFIGVPHVKTGVSDFEWFWLIFG